MSEASADKPAGLRRRSRLFGRAPGHLSLRGRGWSRHRKLKLKGLLAVRSGIKAKRVRQNGNPAYSREIVEAARGITGWPLWLAGQVLVELRDFYLFGILRRTRHPKNIYG